MSDPGQAGSLNELDPLTRFGFTGGYSEYPEVQRSVDEKSDQPPEHHNYILGKRPSGPILI